MSNNNLNVLAGKLEHVHISNVPTVHRFGTAAPKSYVTKRVSKRNTLKKGSPRRKTVKEMHRAKIMQERRRKMVHNTMATRKQAATAKRRQTAIRRKEQEKEAAEKVMITGRTRAQAKKIKAGEGQMLE